MRPGVAGWGMIDTLRFSSCADLGKQSKHLSQLEFATNLASVKGGMWNHVLRI